MIEIPKKEPLNVVPFIDIMLVLLAMVLSISTFIAKGEIDVKLPPSESAQSAQPNEKQVLMAVNAKGEFFMDGEPSTLQAIDTRLATLDKQTRVLLQVDEKSAFSHFIQVIDLLKKHQHENFTIATEKLNGSKAS